MGLRVQDLKRGDRVKDREDSYVCYANSVCIDGVWQVETTASGDHVWTLKDDPDNPIEYDDWIEQVVKRRKQETT